LSVASGDDGGLSRWNWPLDRQNRSSRHRKTNPQIWRDGQGNEMTPLGAKRKFEMLDGLRGVAAFGVLCIHVPDRTIAALLPSSYLAVDLFFGLSGFVLAHAYLARFGKDLRFKSFVLIRLIRLYPYYFLGTAIGVGYALIYFATHRLGPFDTGTFLLSLVFALAFLPVPKLLSFGHLLPYPFLGVAWSLFWELVANWVWARVRASLRGRILLALLLLGAAALGFTAAWFGSLDAGVLWASFWGGGGRVFFSFLAGTALYRIWNSGRIKVRIPAWAAFLVLLLTFAGAPPASLRAGYDVCVVLFIYPALILASANCMTAGPVRSLNAWLGQVSYGVYAIHAPLVPVFSIIAFRIAKVKLEQSGPLGTVAFAAAILLLVTLLDRFYDIPVRRWLGSKLKGRGALAKGGRGSKNPLVSSSGLEAGAP
jgi:peptidoglycan/LPS O-acetylase OafA/YrhL